MTKDQAAALQAYINEPDKLAEKAKIVQEEDAGAPPSKATVVAAAEEKPGKEVAKESLTTASQFAVQFANLGDGKKSNDADVIDFLRQEGANIEPLAENKFVTSAAWEKLGAALKEANSAGFTPDARQELIAKSAEILNDKEGIVTDRKDKIDDIAAIDPTQIAKDLQQIAEAGKVTQK